MTEAEMFEMVATYSSTAMTAFNSYVTFVFAYLATAYFVGNKLSPQQVFTISGLFVIATLVSLFVSNTQIGPIAEFQLELGSEHQYFLIAGLPKAALIRSVLLPLMGLGIIASLYFMWSVRHPKTE